MHKDKNANGEINTNTFNKIYRMEYEKAKFIKLTERKLFKIPSIEKRLNEFCSIIIIDWILSNKFEKDIVVENKCNPKSWISDPIMELKNIILSQIKKEVFIKIPKIINLKIKLAGRSTSCVIVK